MRVKTIAWKSPLLAMLLFLANVYVCRELFSVEYLRHMGSIECTFIAIARYVLANWRDLSWFPLWYNGVPYQNTYPPLLHWVVALVAGIRGFTPAHAYHWTIAVAYCLGPVTLFALVRRLSGSRWAGLLAGMFYTALSPSAWLIPKIVNDMGSPFRPRRLHALLYYGEGPHVAAMTLLPVAFLMVHLAVVKRRPHYVAGAVAAVAAVALTNWLAAFALALGIAAYLLARGRDFLLVAAIGAAAYGLAMPWLPPSTIAVTQYNSRMVVGDFHAVYQTLPLWVAVIAGGLGLLKLATRRLSLELQFAIFFAFPMALITLAEAWFHVAIVPQPDRYHLEMEMAFAMVAGLAGWEVFHRLAPAESRRQAKSLPHLVGVAGIVGLAILLVAPMKICRRYARTFLITQVRIQETSEWKTADWLNRHWSGERVMLRGSTQFWLTVFSNTPQLGGGFDQGITERVLPMASYGVIAGVGGNWAEWSVLWLKALGVQAVGVTGPGSTEVYRDFVDPKKFDGVLDVLWRDGGDVLYRVGRAHGSLARVVPRGSLVTRTPVHAGDVDPLRAYVAALEDPAMPEARFEWIGAHRGRIVTEMGEGQVISWQEAWHAGWHASVGGRSIPIGKDSLGLMTIDPGTGRFVIDLDYDGGVEGRVARWVSGITSVGLVGWVVVGMRRRRAA
jgi:hypothetical protein